MQLDNQLMFCFVMVMCFTNETPFFWVKGCKYIQSNINYIYFYVEFAKRKVSMYICRFFARSCFDTNFKLPRL